MTSPRAAVAGLRLGRLISCRALAEADPDQESLFFVPYRKTTGQRDYGKRRRARVTTLRDNGLEREGASRLSVIGYQKVKGEKQGAKGGEKGRVEQKGKK